MTVNMTVADVARLVGGEVYGDSDARITGVNGIKEAGPGDLCFVRNGQYANYLQATAASAALVSELFPAPKTLPLIVVNSPDLAFAQVLQHIEVQQRRPPSGIHPSAALGENVRLGSGVAIDAFVKICDGAVIGDQVVLYAGVYIGHDARIGAASVLYPNAVVRENCQIGERCILHANCTIGSDGFGFV